MHLITINLFIIRLYSIIFLSLFLGSHVEMKGQCLFNIDTQKIRSSGSVDALLNALKRTNLKQKNDKKAIPSFVTNEINCFLRSIDFPDSFRIANPGEPYNWSDLVDGGLPNRQLLYLGIGKNLLLMTYHHGGSIGASHIVIVKFADSKIRDIWFAEAAKLKTKKSIIAWLEKYKNDVQPRDLFL
jgi:hypothetical protein